MTCDDPGLGKPAFLAAKNAEFPAPGEVEALDYYIRHFVWGGLQRTTDETYAYGIYGIPDWKTNRNSSDPGRNGQLHLWRIYDYPHVIVMYFSMYRIAKNHPHIRTALTAQEYLQRACGTALAMFTVPHDIWPNWSPYGTGFYNERTIVLKEDLSEVRFSLESENTARHQAQVRLSGLPAGRYAVRHAGELIATLDVRDDQEAILELPVNAAGPNSFTVVKNVSR